MAASSDAPPFRACVQAAFGQPQAQPGAAEGPIELITADHRKIEALFDQYERALGGGEKAELCRRICAELVIHILIEEEIFYPECRRRAGRDETAGDKLDEAQVEHDSAKLLVGDLFNGGGADRLRDAKVQVLAEQIRRHIREEEKPGDGVLAKALQDGLDTPGLAARLAQRRQQLQVEQEAGRLRPPPPASIRPPAESLPRERDERRRMMGDDVRDRGPGRPEDDERGYRSQSRGGGGWFGDSEGRSRGAREARDEPRRRPSGWFGDPEGRSHASRDGRAERRVESRSYHPRGHEDYEDGQDYRSQSHGQGGRFTDPEGNARAPSEGWEEPLSEERGHRPRGRSRGGWFGDPESPFRTSREGWDRR